MFISWKKHMLMARRSTAIVLVTWRKRGDMLAEWMNTMNSIKVILKTEPLACNKLETADACVSQTLRNWQL